MEKAGETNITGYHEVMETALSETRPLSEADKAHWLGLIQAATGSPDPQMLALARQRSIELADEEPPAL
ncbi:hypothetical protein [Nonomuraea dietziae]|uniref:hypothetical protein n=2 Tax=Nonomuraea dietziae TaxID=65515 RepID=UPI0033E4106D